MGILSDNASLNIGRSLELYYVDGHPDGMVLAEMYNWIGKVLSASRTQLAEAFRRPETAQTGVYLLLGSREGEPAVYIGEAEDVRTRIKTHDVEKDWWTTVVFVTTTGDQLNKAHVRYLEARLVEDARRIGRTPLANSVNPSRPSLSEADISKMETFLQNLFMVLPALRVDVFVRRARPDVHAFGVKVGTPTATQFVLTNRKHGLEASAVLSEGEFVVEAGSHARLGWEGGGTEETGYGQLHRELLRAGVLQPHDGRCVFTQSYAFRSPSAAASVVMGRSANGRVEWRTPAGVPYNEWELAHLQEKALVAG